MKVLKTLPESDLVTFLQYGGIMTKHYLSHLEDTIIHKQLLLNSCWVMAQYLMSIGKSKLALNLLRRAANHDNSKFYKKEITNFSKLDTSRDDLKHTDNVMSNRVKELVKLHWKFNRHHPEHFASADEMKEIDIIEMVCDWHARSIQFKTNLMDFVTTQQKERFHFSPVVYEKVLHYVRVLLDNSTSNK